LYETGVSLKIMEWSILAEKLLQGRFPINSNQKAKLEL
jgi:hypothetical protein